MRNSDEFFNTIYSLLPWKWIILFFVFFLLIISFSKFALSILGIVRVSENQVMVVIKKFGRRNLANGRIIATDGESGTQAYTLSPGLHFGYFPFQYSIEHFPRTIIPQGKVGLIYAIDGEPIPPGRLLGRYVDCNSFQDGAAFLRNGGQRGPQSEILPPGEYRINLKMFSFTITDAIIIPPNKIGIVTTLDGNPLESGEIAGDIIPDHASFQNVDKFVANGGKRGLQQQIMMSGTYYCNLNFIKVEEADLTDIPIGHVGVVISFVGKIGEDVSGVKFTHGNIVSNGYRGVWQTPLDPGRYPINKRTIKVEIVPTTNTVLNWITGFKEAHNLDAGLESIDVRSKDGFSFKVDVSQIIHIAAVNAPKVIARFGNVPTLISQMLEPAIDNYFRNSAQSSQFLDFLRERATRQEEATEFIRQNLSTLDVEAVNTFIGDIDPPKEIMDTLTIRKLAEEQKTTYSIQRMAQIERIELEKATNEATTQTRVVTANRNVEVALLEAKATIAKAEGENKATILVAEAQAKAIELTGAAEATKISAVGLSEANVLRSKVVAIGNDNWTGIEILRVLAENKVPLVPQIIAGGGAANSGLSNVLLGNLLAKMANSAKTVGE
jgi:uncharacterized membrane protein YqiK